MNIENEVFAGYVANKTSLEEFGFERTDGGYVYSVDFLSGEFKAVVTVDNTGRVTGKVIENALGEEYAAVHVEMFTGGFVGRVRTAYREQLESIRAACFSNTQFIYPQSGRLAQYIFEKYGERPDNPFDDDEGCGVFRYAATRKWYGLIMPVKQNRLFGGDDESVIEVINLKVDPEKRGELLNINGIYPAYHMNKMLWISVLLDGTVEDKLLFSLVDDSRSLVGGRKKHS